MPIVIPTVAEIERMDTRQREAIARRIDADRERAADSLALLLGRPRVTVRFVSRADIKAARTRSSQRRAKDDAATIVADARFLLDRMPPDPDAARHVALVMEAIA